MFKSLTSKNDNLILILIVSVNVILRLWRLSDLFHFTYDEEIFAFVGKRMFINGHIPLIGGVTPFHVHLAPYFYWFSGLLLFISGLNPLGWGIAAAILSGVGIILLYYLVKLEYSKRIALFSAVIYSCSTYINIFDRHYWGLFFNPIFTILIIYSLIKINYGNNRFFILLGLILGLGFHTDPSTIIYFPIVIAFLVIKRLPVWKNRFALVGLTIFLLSFIPLVIFDIRHNFVNISGFSAYFQETKSSTGFSAGRVIDSLIMVPRFFSQILVLPLNVDLGEIYSYCLKYAVPQYTIISSLFIILVLLILLLFFTYKSISEKRNSTRLIIFLFLLSLFSGIFIYNGLLGKPFFLHYLTTAIPIFVIICAVLLESLHKQVPNLDIFLLLIFISYNLLVFYNLQHSYSFSVKSKAVTWAIKNTKGDFSLDSLSSCYKYNGYRYLFLLYGKEPVKSFVDENFFWLYDQLPSETHPQELVVMVASDYQENPKLKKIYESYKKSELKSERFGSLEVMIIDNTKNILYDF